MLKEKKSWQAWIQQILLTFLLLFRFLHHETKRTRDVLIHILYICISILVISRPLYESIIWIKKTTQEKKHFVFHPRHKDSFFFRIVWWSWRKQVIERCAYGDKKTGYLFFLENEKFRVLADQIKKQSSKERKNEKLETNLKHTSPYRSCILTKIMQNFTRGGWITRSITDNYLASDSRHHLHLQREMQE